MTAQFPMPICEQIWDMKYRFKTTDGTPIDETVEDTWLRIAKALAVPESGEIQSDDTDARTFYEESFYRAMEGFKFMPAGRIVAGAGTERAVTLFNCFVMGTIPDSMDGIFTMLREAALTMQQGGGIGYDFSTIRPKTSRVKKLGADASGPLSFMDVWDAMCRTVMSAGSRRGAMMATMRCDHPDIEDFITAKADPLRLRMFNLSVLVTDAFMEAVDSDSMWELVHKEPPSTPKNPPMAYSGGPGRKGDFVGYVHKVVRARELWEQIIRNTYAQAEPGVIFIDRVNKANNLRYCEQIAASNPCGEQMLPPYGACLLGSINLARLVENPFTDKAGIDQFELKRLVYTAVRAMDNVIDVSNFPLEEQRREAEAKRRIGLGVTGLADALVMCGIRYGSDEAVERTEKWMQIIDHAAYEASVKLAAEKGAFPLFNADQYLAEGTHASTLPEGIKASIRVHGVRNALVTSIAPTGTISIYAGNVSSGIEPIFSGEYQRKVKNPDGSHFEETVKDYALHIWDEMGMGFAKTESGSERVFPPHWVTAQDLTPADHVRMQAAAQRHVDNSISKTINVPEDIEFDAFADVYEMAFKNGCKGCTTYRPNEVTGSILSVEEKPKDPPKMMTVEESTAEALKITAEMETGPGRNYPTDDDVRHVLESKDRIVESFRKAYPEISETYMQPATVDLPDRPEELEGSTYKIKVGDHKAVYLTINDTVESDGTVRPFEIFLRSSDPTHDEWMVALARMISAIMRRPHDSSFIGPELMRIHSATSGGFQRGYGYQPSLVAAIGRKIKEHAERSSMMVASDMKWPIPGVQDLVDTTAPTPGDLKEAMEGVPDWFEGMSNVAHPEDAIKSGMILPVKGKPCPSCGSYNFKHESGCSTCIDCGWSSCG